MAYTLAGQNKSDEAQFKAFLTGSERNLIGDLFKRHLPLVFGMCMKYLKTKEAAKEASMEVFERLLAHRPSVEVKDFRAYLYVLTRHHCQMKVRGEKHYIKEVTVEEMEQATAINPIDTPGLDEKKLKQCLGKLPDMQKKCVEALYMENHSYHTISETYGLTIASVKGHIREGKKAFKNCWEGSDETR